MWQAEVRAVLAEIISNLTPDRAARVRGIPVVFEMDPTDINAFAGCDDNGAPFIAGTEGLLEAVDAMSQTKATDEMFGTRTYDAYTNAVMPRLAQGQGATAALPPGLIPPQLVADPRRLSRAHEMFDEIVAFTFGHEAGHHYLGHTGCANGQPVGNGPNLAQLGQLAASVLPIVNQPNEIAADNVGVLSTLDTGYARRLSAYRWTEQGAFTLLDFFTRLESAAGITPLSPVGFLRSHPNSGLRLPLVQAAAATWHFQHQA
jgi:Peptidase family M48